MEQENSKKKKEKSGGNRLVFLLIGSALLIYVAVQVISAFTGSFQTITASHVTVDDSFSTTGWLFRNEVAVPGSSSDSMKHIVYSGERVQQDAALAVVYADEQSLSLSRQIEDLDKQISLLDTALQTAGDGSDSAKLDQLIALSLQQLTGQLKTGSGSSLRTTVDSLRTQSLRRESGSLDAATILSERNTLASQQQSLSAQLSGKQQEIIAPSSGYFSDIVDGYEQTLTVDSLTDMTLERFHDLTKKQPAVDSTGVLGKIVQGFSWYVAAEIPAAQADRLQVGQSLKINFTQASMELPAKVYTLNHERKADTALVVLEGNEFNSEIVSMRDQPIDIIVGTYTGLTVPKLAARMQTDSEGNSTLGVYILSGSMTRFKTIDPIYEADTFYVVQQSATDADALVAQDQVVVQGKGLENNKVVRK